MTHKEVFYLEKSTYVHLFDVLIKVGINGVFGGYFLGFWANLCKNHGGNFFMEKSAYVLSIYFGKKDD